MSDEDVKELLSRAFGQEPPLRLDRDEVLHQGRKRLRRRRFYEAGSVVAVVVLVAVGATLLTNFTGNEPDRMPPAASTTQHAPPGPKLPVPPPRSPTSGVAPPSTTTATNELPIAITSSDADRHLTDLLYAAGVFTDTQVTAVPGTTGPPAFRRVGDQFVYEADLDRARSSGYVQVVVDLSPNLVVDCAHEPGDCELRTQSNLPVSVSDTADTNGERTTRATTVNRNGIYVSAAATNLTHRDRTKGIDPPSPTVVLSDSELLVLLTKVGMSG